MNLHITLRRTLADIWTMEKHLETPTAPALLEPGLCQGHLRKMACWLRQKLDCSSRRVFGERKMWTLKTGLNCFFLQLEVIATFFQNKRYFAHCFNISSSHWLNRIVVLLIENLPASTGDVRHLGSFPGSGSLSVKVMTCQGTESSRANTRAPRQTHMHTHDR